MPEDLQFRNFIVSFKEAESTLKILLDGYPYTVEFLNTNSVNKDPMTSFSLWHPDEGEDRAVVVEFDLPHNKTNMDGIIQVVRAYKEWHG